MPASFWFYFATQDICKLRAMNDTAKNGLYKWLWLVWICPEAIWHQRPLSPSKGRWTSYYCYRIGSVHSSTWKTVYFSKTVSDHLSHLRRLLTLLRNAGIKFNLKMPLLRGDNRLPRFCRRTRKVRKRGINDNGDLRIMRPYNTDGRVILCEPL